MKNYLHWVLAICALCVNRYGDGTDYAGLDYCPIDWSSMDADRGSDNDRDSGWNGD